MPGPVAVLVQYTAQAGQEDRARAELAELIEVVRGEDACQGIVLHRDPDRPERFLLYERWSDRESYLGEHMRTPHLTAFITRAHTFLAGPPEITLWDPL